MLTDSLFQKNTVPFWIIKFVEKHTIFFNREMYPDERPKGIPIIPYKILCVIIVDKMDQWWQQLVRTTTTTRIGKIMSCW